MNKNTNNIITLDQFKDKHFGELGTVSRDELDNGYQFFKRIFLKKVSNK
ncbi:hypothetical protein [Roseivirga pacifica]